MSNTTWPTKKIGELFDVQLGKMLSEKAKQGVLLPYLANFNVRWGAFDFSRLNEMTFSEREQEKYSLYPGDLLMCEGGEIGRCAVWKGANKTIYFQKALHRLRPLNQDISTEFIYYYMQHIASKGDLPKLVGETSIAHLTREKLLCLRVPTPDPPEQTAIASLLSTWDFAIEKTERLIAAKEKRFTWLLNELINKPISVDDADSRRSNQPQWRNIKLCDVAKIAKGQQLNVAHMVDNGKYYALNGGIEPSGYTNDWNTPENTITISEGGNSCGFINFNREKFWSGGHCYSLLNIDNSVHIEFLYHFLKSKEKLIMSLRVGSGLPNIQKKDIDCFIVATPDLDQQKQIAAILTTARQEIDLLKKQADAYRRQKRGLMQRLLTGEWRVRVG